MMEYLVDEKDVAIQAAARRRAALRVLRLGEKGGTGHFGNAG